jgi:hypothetical protein
MRPGPAIGADAAAGGHDGVAFGVVERGGFAGGREGDHAGSARGQHLVGQVLQRVEIHVAAWVERRHQRDVHTTKLQLSDHPATTLAGPTEASRRAASSLPVRPAAQVRQSRRADREGPSRLSRTMPPVSRGVTLQ